MYTKLYTVDSNYYTNASSQENFISISGALTCPMRKPTKKDVCFCKEPLNNSPYEICQQYMGKSNICMETVCCSSCDMDQISKCRM
jgi:hypothetical protein